MRHGFVAAIALSLLVPASISGAELDLDQELLVIPDTHNEKPYIWNVARNPKGYELAMEYSDQASPARFSFEVRKDTAEKIREVHVFITDSDIHLFRHIRPVEGDGRYQFPFEVPANGSYRFEIVLKTEKGWANLRKDVRLKGVGKQTDDPERDRGYSVNLKLIPRKVYAEHVVTFLFDIAYNGQPIRDIEKVDGTDMRFASWDEDLKEFLYVTSKQNLGGPEVAISTVFMRPGKRAVFAEFRHRGETRSIEMVVDVLMEPPQGTYIHNLKPADN